MEIVFHYQTTLNYTVGSRSNPQDLFNIVAKVDNYYDVHGRLIEFHTSSVNFYGAIPDKTECESIEKEIKLAMDSSNPKAWEEFGNKTVQEIRAAYRGAGH